MLTRCPHCQTDFRVTSEQLKLRQGQVRCGECLGVFNALESLADETVATVSVVPEHIAVAVPAPVESPPHEPDAASAPPAEPPVEPVAVAESPDAGPLPVSETAETPAVPEPPNEPDGQEVATAMPPQAAAAAPLPAAWDAPDESVAPLRWPWAVGALVLFLVGLAQLVYLYRVDILIRFPEARPILAGACAELGCTLPRPRKSDLAAIESSDLAPEAQDRLLLTASLKNRAGFLQDFPHLELTLTDVRDSALLRKVLAPEDYLPEGQTVAAGFAPRQEITVKLLLEAKGIPAEGYRLYLFYP